MYVYRFFSGDVPYAVYSCSQTSFILPILDAESGTVSPTSARKTRWF